MRSNALDDGSDGALDDMMNDLRLLVRVIDALGLRQGTNPGWPATEAKSRLEDFESRGELEMIARSIQAEFEMQSDEEEDSTESMLQQSIFKILDQIDIRHLLRRKPELARMNDGGDDNDEDEDVEAEEDDVDAEESEDYVMGIVGRWESLTAKLIYPLTDSDLDEEVAKASRPSLRPFISAIDNLWEALRPGNVSDSVTPVHTNALVRVIAVMEQLGIRGSYATRLQDLIKLDIIPEMTKTIAERLHTKLNTERTEHDEELSSFAAIVHGVIGNVDAQLAVPDGGVASVHDRIDVRHFLRKRLELARSSPADIDPE